ncbi:MAG: nucleotidyltransferase family protein, partial [Lachnospiraceae bacterium]|nr:nucleotidyltransferase family protein [Lachnospiraceae bacterium]
STALLHKIKENSSIPLITKNAKASSLLSERDFSLFAKECSNSHIYQTVVSHKYHLALQNEYTKTPVMI